MSNDDTRAASYTIEWDDGNQIWILRGPTINEFGGALDDEDQARQWRDELNLAYEAAHAHAEQRIAALELVVEAVRDACWKHDDPSSPIYVPINLRNALAALESHTDPSPAQREAGPARPGGASQDAGQSEGGFASELHKDPSGPDASGTSRTTQVLGQSPTTPTEPQPGQTGGGSISQESPGALSSAEAENASRGASPASEDTDAPSLGEHDPAPGSPPITEADRLESVARAIFDSQGPHDDAFGWDDQDFELHDAYREQAARLLDTPAMKAREATARDEEREACAKDAYNALICQDADLALEVMRAIRARGSTR